MPVVELSVRGFIALYGAYQGALDKDFFNNEAYRDMAVRAASRILAALELTGIILERQTGASSVVSADDKRSITVELPADEVALGYRLCRGIAAEGSREDSNVRTIIGCLPVLKRAIPGRIAKLPNIILTPNELEALSGLRPRLKTVEVSLEDQQGLTMLYSIIEQLERGVGAPRHAADAILAQKVLPETPDFTINFCSTWLEIVRQLEISRRGTGEPEA